MIEFYEGSKVEEDWRDSAEEGKSLESSGKAEENKKEANMTLVAEYTAKYSEGLSKEQISALAEMTDGPVKKQESAEALNTQIRNTKNSQLNRKSDYYALLKQSSSQVEAKFFIYCLHYDAVVSNKNILPEGSQLDGAIEIRPESRGLLSVGLANRDRRRYRRSFSNDGAS